jgi:hypothetical protein
LHGHDGHRGRNGHTASFLTTEDLLYEVTDHPKEVLRLCREITDLWLKFFEEFGEIIKGQRVFSD